jgi:hypothetical protein
LIWRGTKAWTGFQNNWCDDDKSASAAPAENVALQGGECAHRLQRRHHLIIVRRRLEKKPAEDGIPEETTDA